MWHYLQCYYLSSNFPYKVLLAELDCVFDDCLDSETVLQSTA